MTEFSQVYEFFLSSLSNEYRLRNLFEQNPEVAEDLLFVWLMKSIVLFQNRCSVNLEDFSKDLKVFNRKLSLTEISILSDLMILMWMDWNINDITQMNLSLSDTDYKTYAEERNLTGKSQYRDKHREIVFQEMSQFNSNQISVEKWASGRI